MNERRSESLLLALGIACAAIGAEGGRLHQAFAVLAVSNLAVCVFRRSGRARASILAVALGFPLVADRIVEPFEAWLNRAASWHQVKQGIGKFESMRSDLKHRADRAVAAVNGQVERPEPPESSRSRFDSLRVLLADRYSGFVLYEPDPVLWGGSVPGFMDEMPQAGERVVTVGSSAYYALVVPLKGQAGDARLSVYRLLSVHSDVPNRWLVDYDFFDIHPELQASSIEVTYGDGQVDTATGVRADSGEWLLRMSEVAGRRIDLNGVRLLAPLLLLALAVRFFALRSRRSTGGDALYAAGAALLVHAIGSSYVSSPVFGPAHFALPVKWGLIASPADLLLAALVLAIGIRALPVERLRKGGPRLERYGLVWSSVMLAGAVALFAGFLALMQSVVRSVSGSFLLTPLVGVDLDGGWRNAHVVIQSALLIILACVAGLSIVLMSRAATLLRRNAHLSSRRSLVPVAFAAPLILGHAAFSLWVSRPVLGAGVLLLACLSYRGESSRWSWKRVAAATLPLLAIYQISGWVMVEQGRRECLAERTVERIRGEGQWALYLLGRAQKQVDQHLAGNPDVDNRLAFHAWARTDLALFGFSSGVEIFDAFGNGVARFRLNMDPAAGRPPVSADMSWQVSTSRDAEHARLHTAERVFGPAESPFVVRIYVQEGYDNLLFLSSASPYLALFRGQQLDILEQRLFGGRLSLMVFDEERHVVFNPALCDFILTDSDRGKLANGDRTKWTAFTSAGKDYTGLLFRSGSHVGLLFYPRTTIAGHVALFVRLLFHIVVLCPLLLLFHAPRNWLPRRMRFATKVYLGLLGASIVPLIAYSLLLGGYLDRKLAREAETYGITVAQVARRFIEDFVAFRMQRGELPSEIFNDDLALWVQRIVRQDLNIYWARELVATSKRELFESGLLNAYVDGDVYQRIAGERTPFSVAAGHLGRLRLLSISTPLVVAGIDEPVILSVPTPIDERERQIEAEELGQSLILISTVVVILALLIAHRLADRISRPVDTLIEGTAHIAKGDFDYRIEAVADDEVGTLVDSFNRMATDLKAYQEETIRASRLKVLAEMARRVAHEIKNPLTPIQLSVEHLRKVFKDGSAEFPRVLEICVETVLREVETLRKLSRDFGLISRADEPSWAEVDLRRLLDEITDPYRTALDGRIEFQIEWEPEESRYVLDVEKCRRALTNVLLNAVQATNAGSIAWHIAEEPPFVVLRLRDTGAGMPPEVQAKIFQPYFSTKDRGTGLGLAISRKDLEDQGGRIAIETTSSAGTTVLIHLPIRRQEGKKNA